MDTQKICPGCQRPLVANAPDGLCPECLMKAGLDSGADIGAVSRGERGRTSFVAPTVEEVARLFPQFEILGFIGQGGMGVVYKVRQKTLDRVVALKILPPGIGKEPAFAERFTREAKALARLNHPGVVTLYEFGQADGLFFFLMEFVDGMSLRHLLEVERISAREALAIVPQICDALQYAHDQGIVHRDIKPENILLDRQGRVKVADFGLAKLVEPGTEPLVSGNAATASLTEVGKVMGTPQYMAPEQREHPTEVDHRADIYSLGVVFYQMLTGELPGQRIEPPSQKVQIDVRLDEVVLRALEKEPRRRYQQVSQVKSDVETIARSGMEEVSAAPLAVGTAAKGGNGASVWARRKSWGFLFASACFLVGALISGEKALVKHATGSSIAIVLLNLVAAAGFAVAAYRQNRAVRFAAAAMATLAGLAMIGVVGGILGGAFPLPGSQPDPAWALAKLPEGASFGPVIERVITVGNRNDSFYRIDPGEYVAPSQDFDPSAVKEPTDLWKWLTEHNVDFLAQRHNGKPVLTMSDMVTANLDLSDFDRLTPQSLFEQTAWRTTLNRQSSDRRPAVTGLLGNPVGKSVVAFQTRYEVIGLLHVLGTVSEPPGVRFRYKLVSTPGNPGRMAEAPPPSVPVLAAKPGQYAVALSNGATLEVVAVARNPRNTNLWWRPDGVVLAEPPADELRFTLALQGGENAENEFALLTRTVTASGDKAFSTWPVYVPSPTRSPSLGVTLFNDRGFVSDAPLLWFARPPETLTYRFGLAAGPWAPVALHDGSTTQQQPGEGAVEFTSPQSEGENTVLRFRHTVDRKRFCLRLVVERTDGVPAEVALWDHYSTNGLNAARAIIHDVSPSQIKRYHVLKTPWLWGEISGIAMKPAADFSAQGPGSNSVPTQTSESTAARTREPEGFGPIIERLVNADGATENILIDFESGRLVFPPPDLNRKDRTALQAWLRKEGVDALADAGEAVRGFIGFDMIARPVSARQWDNAPGTAVAGNEFLTLGRPGSPVYLSAKGRLPETFFIKTREGGMGILQITGFTENPRGVRVSYKLVQSQTMPTEKGVQGAKGAALQFRLVADGVDTEPAEEMPDPNDKAGRMLRVRKAVLLDESAVAEVCLTNSIAGRPQIRLQWTPTGASRFKEITGTNVGRRLGIVLNGRLLAAPMIQSEIADAATIEGLTNEEEAVRTVMALKAVTQSRGRQSHEEHQFSFGPEIEQLIRQSDADAQGFVLFSLQTGKLLKPPFPLSQSVLGSTWGGLALELQQWIRTNDADVLLYLDDQRWALRSQEMDEQPLGPPDQWERVTADSVAAAFRGGSTAYAQRLLGGPFLTEANSGDRFTPCTAFRTRRNSTGIWQVAGVNTAPRGVKIRYRLLQSSSAVLGSPRGVVAEWLRRVKAGSPDAWDLTTRSNNVGWGPDFTGLWEFDRIRPLHQMGNEDQAMVLSNPFKDNAGQTRGFYAALRKRDGQWLVDRHDYVSPSEASSVMKGFAPNPSMKFDVLAEEFVGEWHAVCDSTISLAANGTGAQLRVGPGGPEPGAKPESFKWEVSGATLRRHFADREEKLELLWMDDNDVRFRSPNESRWDAWWRKPQLDPPEPASATNEAPQPPEKAAALQSKSEFSFGPVIERVLAFDTERASAYLDLDTGEYVDPGAKGTTYGMKATPAGVDLKATAIESDTRARLAVNMALVPVAAARWDATPDEIRKGLAGVQRQAEVRLDSGSRTNTFFFRTSEGGTGVIQWLPANADADPSQVRVRYKLVQGTRSNR